MSASFPSTNHLIWFQNQILKWFSKYGRDFPWRNQSCSCYERIISEVLLQRTRAETVALFFPKFVKRFPSWKAIAELDVEELESVLKPIGLWKQRAARLLQLSREAINFSSSFPTNQKELEALPGVGQYIANAIQLFCHGIPRPLLDGNMARILERVFGPRTKADIRYDPYLQELSSKAITHSYPIPMNWGILDIASTICKKKPKCSVCPLAEKCNHRAITV